MAYMTHSVQDNAEFAFTIPRSHGGHNYTAHHQLSTYLLQVGTTADGLNDVFLQSETCEKYVQYKTKGKLPTGPDFKYCCLAIGPKRVRRGARVLALVLRGDGMESYRTVLDDSVDRHDLSATSSPLDLGWWESRDKAVELGRLADVG